MRIFFIGTVKFSHDALKALLENGASIVGVATKDNASVNADYTDLRPICEEFSVPYKVVNNINHPNNLKFIADFKPDVIYCFGWSNLLGRELLSIAPKGVIGFHPAAIPANRGRHPIIWALCLGLKETASSFFFMDEGADTGDIISQVKVQISDHDDADSLYKKITETAVDQIISFTTQLELNKYTRTKQQPGGNVWRKRGKKDGEIDFRMSSTNIYNLVRALTLPYVGAHCHYEGRDVKIWKVGFSDLGDENDEPGKVLKTDTMSLVIKTGDGAIEIISHEFEELPKFGTYL